MPQLPSFYLHIPSAVEPDWAPRQVKHLRLDPLALRCRLLAVGSCREAHRSGHRRLCGGAPRGLQMACEAVRHGGKRGAYPGESRGGAPGDLADPLGGPSLHVPRVRPSRLPPEASAEGAFSPPVYTCGVFWRRCSPSPRRRLSYSSKKWSGGGAKFRL